MNWSLRALAVIVVIMIALVADTVLIVNDITQAPTAPKSSRLGAVVEIPVNGLIGLSAGSGGRNELCSGCPTAASPSPGCAPGSSSIFDASGQAAGSGDQVQRCTSSSGSTSASGSLNVS